MQRRPGFVLTREDWLLIVHFTRNWLHYGWLTVVTLFVAAGAVKGLLGG